MRGKRAQLEETVRLCRKADGVALRTRRVEPRRSAGLLEDCMQERESQRSVRGVDGRIDPETGPVNRAWTRVEMCCYWSTFPSTVS